jgi:hypothetical protein
MCQCPSLSITRVSCDMRFNKIWTVPHIYHLTGRDRKSERKWGDSGWSHNFVLAMSQNYFVSVLVYCVSRHWASWPAEIQHPTLAEYSGVKPDLDNLLHRNPCFLAFYLVRRFCQSRCCVLFQINVLVLLTRLPRSGAEFYVLPYTWCQLFCQSL